MSKPYSLSDFITDLQALERGYGDIPVLTGRGNPLFARQLEVVKIDDWTTSTKTDDGEIPGVGYAIEIGPRF